MITEKDYLKSYKMMNDDEKKDYLDSVTRWSEETFPSLMALADSWEKVPVKEFDEGLRLVSAIMKARSFISVAQRYDAQRAINKMNEYLTEVRVQSGLAKKSTRSMNDPRKYRAIVPATGVPDVNGLLKNRQFKVELVDDRRPDHLCQYIDMLPPELQKKTEGFNDMYLALAEYRGRLEVLTENPQANEQSIAEFAEKSVKQEQAIRSIWAEVDEAVAVANGAEPIQPVADVLDNMKRPGEYTRVEIEAMLDEAMRESCKKKRIEGNKKYVRRTDLTVTDEYKEQMKVRITELLGWNESIPKKTMEICENAGILIEGFNDTKSE